MKRKNKRTPPKEEIAEDYCFICKDGGELLICDYKQCLKSYHFDCVGKDESFKTSKETWTCDWHSCLVCHEASKFHCYCCPKAVCGSCTRAAEFAVVKGKNGFCFACLKLAGLIEENMDADSDGEKVDFRDRETYEGLFMEYYKIVQEKEGFNADNVLDAKNRLKMAKNVPLASESDEYTNDGDDEEDEEMISDYESMQDTEGWKPPGKKKGFKARPSMMQKNVRTNRMQFCGWGSTSLIQFLRSIGRDTSEKLSQQDVSFIINAYVREHNLYHPKKKRHIVCDEKLRSVFGRKTVHKNRIYDLLEVHFADNLEESEEESDDIGYQDYEEGDLFLACKTRKRSKKERESPKRDELLSAPCSCYAAVTVENIKIIYLRRSLIQELSKQPESFERKVIGSYVRVKSDPNDYYQRNSHQLSQVTGIKNVSTGENTAEIILYVSSMPKEVNLSMLSDADFTEEECEDLRDKVKNGQIERPTVVKLQEKAKSLHEDMTKHWISRELKLLDKRIDQANEKGWRREFFEYMEKKKQLQTPSEQSRLLANYPIVIPDVAEFEAVNEAIMDEQKEGEDSLSCNPSSEWEGNGTSNANECYGHASIQEEKLNLIEKGTPESPQQSTSKEKKNKNEIKVSIDEECLKQSLELAPEDQCQVTFQNDAENCSSHIAGTEQDRQNNSKWTALEKQDPLADKVIDLSSDDEEHSKNALGKQKPEDLESSEWLILGPNGERMGKHSLSLLKRWSEASPYAFKFKVWKENQGEEHAIWLSDALKQASSGH